MEAKIKPKSLSYSNNDQENDDESPSYLIEQTPNNLP
jgi:hypothetical protein